nr:MAG: transcriptional regulator [Sphaerobacter thermophilus]
MREALRNARKEQGMTQAEVAAAVGISRNYYNEIEMGRGCPHGAILLRLAKVLKADPMVLFADVLDDHDGSTSEPTVTPERVEAATR